MSVKDIVLKPVDSRVANAHVKEWHYSGKVVNNSQLHFGVFLDKALLGVMQFGPSMDKSKIMPLVKDTGWNEFIELNRMAFSDALPRNSESRAISVAMKLIKKRYPHIKWVVSFADATQCGDGAIYRASGFVLTGIKKNTQVVEFPDGSTESRLTLTDRRKALPKRIAKKYGVSITAKSSLKPFLEAGGKMKVGFQLRYIYFIDKFCAKNLTVPILPFKKIKDMGASMYLGKPCKHSADADTFQVSESGSIPTAGLQHKRAI